MRKFLIVLCLFFVSSLAYAYEVLQPAPDDIVGFVSWIMQQVDAMKTGNWQVITAIVVAGLLGIFKFASKSFAAQMEKLGNWQFVIPVVLGAIGELILNFPHPFQWMEVIPVIIAGGTSTGLMAVAVYHIHKKFPFGLQLLQFVQGVLEGFFKKPQA